MSIRAYGIKIEYEKLTSTFNLWDDENIVDAILCKCNVYVDDYEGNIGFVSIDKDDLDNMKEYWIERKIELTEEEKEKVKAIEENIRNGICDYICF